MPSTPDRSVVKTQDLRSGSHGDGCSSCSHDEGTGDCRCGQHSNNARSSNVDATIGTGIQIVGCVGKEVVKIITTTLFFASASKPNRLATRILTVGSCSD